MDCTKNQGFENDGFENQWFLKEGFGGGKSKIKMKNAKLQCKIQRL